MGIGPDLSSTALQSKTIIVQLPKIYIFFEISKIMLKKGVSVPLI